jgi:hypothetical protein
MGNVESLGSRSPINARGSLIHQENKRQPHALRPGRLVGGSSPLAIIQINYLPLRALLPDAIVRDEITHFN